MTTLPQTQSYKQTDRRTYGGPSDNISVAIPRFALQASRRTITEFSGVGRI